MGYSFVAGSRANNGKMNEGRLALSQCESTFIHFAVVGA